MLDLENSGWNIAALGDVDHTRVKAPYIRVDSIKKGKNGDFIFKYDLRFTQPNKNFMSSDIVHSLEHFLLVGFRNHVKSFIGVAPMGCHTGFYLFLINDFNSNVISDYLEQILKEILISTEVPLSTELTCGHAANHNIEGAKEMAKHMLSKKYEWLNVF